MTSNPARWKLGACILFVVVVSGATAWWRAYSTIAPYDDEGTLMLSVQRFFDGRILYDHLLSNYGPLFYACQSIPHAITGAPISHDSVRLLDVISWVAASILLLLLVYRATGSVLLALAVHFVGFRILRFIGNEAVHPQELCILMLLGVALAACARPRAAAAWFGVLAGAAIATKINFGILLFASLAVFFAFALPPGWLRRVAAPASAAAALALPFLLMTAHLSQPWALCYALLVTASLMSALLAAAHRRVKPLAMRDLAVACLASLATIALAVSFVVAHGSTVAGLIRSVVLGPRAHFAQSWYVPLEVPVIAVLWAAANLPLAWFAVRGRLPDAFLASLKLVFAAAVVILALVTSFRELLLASTPLLWLVAVAPPGPPRTGASDWLRPLLAVLGVFQALYPYPVAGEQIAFPAVIVLAIAAICLSDALPVLPGLTARRAAAIAVVLLLSLNAIGAYRAFLRFQSKQPLGLPGAQRLRAAPELAGALRRIGTAAQACSMLVTQPGLFSLNLFSGTPPPYVLRSGAWMRVMSDADQALAIRELQTQPRACAVYSPEILKYWRVSVQSPRGPLERYIHDNFHTEFQTGDYQFMVRR